MAEPAPVQGLVPEELLDRVQRRTALDLGERLSVHLGTWTEQPYDGTGDRSKRSSSDSRVGHVHAFSRLANRALAAAIITPVVAGLACPSITCTVARSTPASSKSPASDRRQSCGGKAEPRARAAR